jgi:carbonic anhydrase
MKRHEQLLSENKQWAKEVVQEDPEYFSRLVNVQKPDFLWIGCADSRVPPDKITQTQPGQIFIHRNVANMVVHTDMNLLSVLQYAVEVLKVKDVIVCGHYNCGGIKTAMTRESHGLIDNWLRNIKDVYRLHQQEVDSIPNETARLNRMVELNVREQLLNLAKTTIIQKAWKADNRPHLHGWVYDLHDGVLNPILELSPNDDLDNAIYQYDNLG